ncbi:uncharacterized protein BJ212DRAFT_1478630 [Suillus subaureus]|uniref:C2 PI3K-type domain-containing protein n=1 Tax=Suillus subaureus TaxID=48587 RepID=A0A9P7EGX4_9AGAM|nr:uncharacterized protein BJ212DRAFT_1478630 [Suillus subaureus]KAG1820526.1 hypothetical protein BJ212DRAFT_1478630 [Suillus subaureus]
MDNRDDFTFAKLSDFKFPVTSDLGGSIQQSLVSVLLENPELRFYGAQFLYYLCLLLAPAGITSHPFHTSSKALKNNYTYTPPYITVINSNYLHRWNEWITLPIRYCDPPLSSQTMFTVWDIEAPRVAVPVGGSTFRMFGKKWFENIACCSGQVKKQTIDDSMQTSTPSKPGSGDETGCLEKLMKN